MKTLHHRVENFFQSEDGELLIQVSVLGMTACTAILSIWYLI